MLFPDDVLFAVKRSSGGKNVTTTVPLALLLWENMFGDCWFCHLAEVITELFFKIMACYQRLRSITVRLFPCIPKEIKTEIGKEKVDLFVVGHTGKRNKSISLYCICHITTCRKWWHKTRSHSLL